MNVPQVQVSAYFKHLTSAYSVGVMCSIGTDRDCATAKEVAVPDNKLRGPIQEWPHLACSKLKASGSSHDRHGKMAKNGRSNKFKQHGHAPFVVNQVHVTLMNKAKASAIRDESIAHGSLALIPFKGHSPPK